MGSVKIDIHRAARKLAQDYDLSTKDGVKRFLGDWHEIWAKALREGSIDVVDLRIDTLSAMSGLDVSEQVVVLAITDGRWTVEETEFVDKATLNRACEKIAKALGETEGYEK